MPHIALVTCAELPQLAPDEAPFVAALKQRGAQVTAAVWNDPAIDWSSFSQVITRNPWDYHQHAPQAFPAWVQARGEGGPPLHNAAEVMRWNLDKRYLHAVPGAVPTLFAVSQAEREEALGRACERGWFPLVIKPAYSAGGRSTTVAHNRNEARRQLAAAPEGRLLLQPLLPEIHTAGELSLIFVGGEYQHAVVKRAASGEFRIHERYGGTVAAHEPSAAVKQAAHDALRAAPGSTTYARVDGVVTATGFAIMELELVEPELFFRFRPATAQALAALLLGAG